MRNILFGASALMISIVAVNIGIAIADSLASNRFEVVKRRILAREARFYGPGAFLVGKGHLSTTVH